MFASSLRVPYSISLHNDSQFVSIYVIISARAVIKALIINIRFLSARANRICRYLRSICSFVNIISGGGENIYGMNFLRVLRDLAEIVPFGTPFSVCILRTSTGFIPLPFGEYLPKVLRQYLSITPNTIFAEYLP